MDENHIAFVEGEDGIRDEVVALFARVGEWSEWKYPPAVRIVQVGSLQKWVWLHPENLRWDAVYSTGKVVGSIQINLPPEESSLERLTGLAKDVGKFLGEPVAVGALGLVERFAVDPDFRMRGCGRLLLRMSLDEISRSERLAALEVLTSQKEALGLYQSEGGVVVGETVGLSGLPILRVCFPSVR